MFTILVAVFILFLGVDGFLSAHVIYHLKTSSPKDNPFAKAVIPVYIILALLIIGLELIWLIQISRLGSL